MEKLGVVLDDSMTKTGAVGSLCPKCGATLETPKKCSFCGTEPFEKKAEAICGACGRPWSKHETSEVDVCRLSTSHR